MQPLSPRDPITRLLILALALMLSRWIEMRTGWSDALVVPLSALGALVLFEVLVMPPGSRLGARGWGITLAGAAALAALLRAMGA
jgi:hypothetical protein